MRILGINHIGLAAKDPQKARWFFEKALNLPFEGEELVVEQMTNTIMFQAQGLGLTSPPMSRLEILENEAGKEGPIAKFIEKRGGGIHHVALSVDNVDEAIKHLEALGVQMIDKIPRKGAHKTRIAFVHPSSAGGLLIELVEESKGHK